ncbi:MAG: hypothetical protein CMN72_11340 [Sphingomonas sp.]|nr:hypothetical protein [Sphingomonas sp.]
MTARDTSPKDDPAIIALGALGWILQSDSRGERFLALTGLDVDTLRARAGTPHIMMAAIAFLENYEPDLIACADALDRAPADLVSARRALEDICDRC